MNSSIIPFVQYVVADRVGLSATARIEHSGVGDTLIITPTDLHPNEGFAVHLRFGWRSVEASIVPGLFSGQLIARMGASSIEGRHIFTTLARGLVLSKKKILLRVNGAEFNALEAEAWPSTWSKFELSLRLTPVVIDPADLAQQERMVIDLGIPILNMIVAMVGVEETGLVTQGENEGQPSETRSRRYERSRLNREACIQLKGSRCLACGFDFAAAYGALGAGYIEVHHLNPLAILGGDYHIDVVTELVPLCANCHAMVHREEPPVPLERLTQLIEDRRRAAPL
jgi:5-methylcytosine-specific restriction protein A